MRHILLLFTILIFIGCGEDNSPTANLSEITDNSIESNVTIDENTSTATDNSVESNEAIDENTSNRVVNIYIHGYNQEGEKQTDTYGKDESDVVLENIVETTGYSTMKNYLAESERDIIVMTDYYGSTAPEYYTPEDIRDVEDTENGIPRYALIIAKYIKYIQRETKTTNVNIISASMGTLVSRYLIEKNLENLSSDKKIKKWLSFEGVVKGNVAASKENLVFVIDTFVNQSSEVAHMHYDWIRENLDENSSYYEDIQIGFESSTRDDLNDGLITELLLADGKNPANDGVQAVNDTFFANPHTHVLFHENHSSLTQNMAAWGFAATFLTSKKHVRITLIEATVSDLHEPLTDEAEIVFESTVYSLKAQEKWNFTNAIDERMLDSGYLKLYKYASEGEQKVLNQVVFNSYILDNETELTLEITPYELDNNIKYKLVESLDNKHETLGKGTLSVPVENEIYEISGSDWSGKVKVEVAYEY